MVLKVKIEDFAIHHAAEVYEIMQLVLKRERKINKGKEHFWVIALNNAHKIINLELISIGNATCTVVKPMEVLSIPLQKRAMGVILVHNHPSGKLEPSEEDKDLTDRLIQACKLMHTPVLDHVIITERSYYSFKSSGLLERLEASNKYVLPYDLEKQYHEEMQVAIKALKQESAKEVQTSLQKGIQEGSIRVARQMMLKGYALEVIQELTGIDYQMLLALKEELG